MVGIRPHGQVPRPSLRAVTDSGTEITFEDEKPGVKNLLTIQSVLTGKTPDQLVAHYAGKQYGHLKLDTAEVVVNAIRPIREKTDQLLKDLGYLDSILRDGAVRARIRARTKMAKVCSKIGLLYQP